MAVSSWGEGLLSRWGLDASVLVDVSLRGAVEYRVPLVSKLTNAHYSSWSKCLLIISTPAPHIVILHDLSLVHTTIPSPHRVQIVICPTRSIEAPSGFLDGNPPYECIDRNTIHRGCVIRRYHLHVIMCKNVLAPQRLIDVIANDIRTDIWGPLHVIILIYPGCLFVALRDVIGGTSMPRVVIFVISSFLADFI